MLDKKNPKHKSLIFSLIYAFVAWFDVAVINLSPIKTSQNETQYN